MNRVAINVNNIPMPGWTGAMEAYALKVLEMLKLDNWDLSVLLCDDETIKELNSRYRNKAEATDVLSFELGIQMPCEPSQEGGARYLPGDIVVSLDSLRENSIFFKIPEDEELRRLTIHGILHLKGMDHKTNDKTEPMLILQEDILKNLNGEHILPGGKR